MQDLIARVEALIARSASERVEEARTSAFIACRLIREHGLEVRPKGERRATGGGFGGYSGFDDWFNVNREPPRPKPRRDATEEQAMREWEERQERERRAERQKR